MLHSGKRTALPITVRADDDTCSRGSHPGGRCLGQAPADQHWGLRYSNHQGLWSGGDTRAVVAFFFLSAQVLL